MAGAADKTFQRLRAFPHGTQYPIIQRSLNKH
jgi:hypothetical protein